MQKNKGFKGYLLPIEIITIYEYCNSIIYWEFEK